jgi:hypothetical protein
MKNNFAYSISPFLFLLFALSARGQSGFMRDVLNAVKGTAQNRANNTATQGTNKAIDLVDPATQSKSHSGSSGGSSASNRQRLYMAYWALLPERLPPIPTIHRQQI